MEVHSLVYEIVQDVDGFVRGHVPVVGTPKQQCRHPPTLDAVSPGDLQLCKIISSWNFFGPTVRYTACSAEVYVSPSVKELPMTVITHKTRPVTLTGEGNRGFYTMQKPRGSRFGLTDFGCGGQLARAKPAPILDSSGSFRNIRI